MKKQIREVIQKTDKAGNVKTDKERKSKRQKSRGNLKTDVEGWLQYSQLEAE